MYDRRYFEVNYPDYLAQNPHEKLDFYCRLIRTWARTGQSVFELGVGLGSFFSYASERFPMMGCDPNPVAVENTQKLNPSSRILTGSTEVIPAGVHAVVSWDVLEHLPDLDGGLKAISERLATEGVLIGVVPIYGGPLGWLVRLLDRDPTHFQKLTTEQWLVALNHAGFEVKTWGGILRKLVGSHYFHLTHPQWFFRIFCSAIYFVAQKRKV